MRTGVIHTVTWLVILTVSLLLYMAGATKLPTHPAMLDYMLYLHFIVAILLIASLFYFYAYFLIPRLLYKKKLILFILISVLLTVMFVLTMNFTMQHFIGLEHLQPPVLSMQPGMHPPGADSLNHFPPPPGFDPKQAIPPPPDALPGQRKMDELPYSLTVLPFLIMLASAIAYRYVLDSVKKEKKLQEEKLAAVTSELQFLKLQISPHFLFNVMNNLTFLARRNSDLLEPSLQKLSSLLRYTLYDTNAEHVPLDTEIKHLEDYIGLQQLRYQEIQVKSYFQNDEDDLSIAPMLLIPFVENAFKHTGGMMQEGSFILIELIVQNGKIHFKVVNKFQRMSIEQMDTASGIGLANVKKRLQLIYPAKHFLSINEIDDSFEITLQIQLK